MSNILRGFAISFLLSFVFVEFAQAGLLRTSGRGRLSRNFDQAVFFVADENVNANGWIGGASSDPFEFEFFDTIGRNSRSIPQAGLAASAVPGGCVREFFQSDVDNAINDILDQLSSSSTFDGLTPEEADQLQSALEDELNRLESGGAPNPEDFEPCRWEFEEGEDLLTFGSFSLFFDTLGVEYDVDWLISGNGVDLRLPGSVNLNEFTTPGGEIVSRGSVLLDSLAPAALVGANPFLDYAIAVEINLNPLGGAFFYTLDDPARDEVSIQKVCEELPADPGLGAPPEFVCGFTSVVDATYGDPLDWQRADGFETRFVSDPEILRIFASNNTDPQGPVGVPGPSTLASLLAGLLFLAGRRRSRNA